MRKRIFLNLSLVIVLLMVTSDNLSAAPFDSQAFRQILKNHRTIVRSGAISYAGIRYDDPALRALSARAMAEVEAYSGSTPAEWKAFYINAYNIAVIHLIAENWPVRSILDLEDGKVFQSPRVLIQGRRISLDDLEKKVLRPSDDPRVHFALVCAAIGCPDLRSEPYMPVTLDAQLNDQTVQYLNSARGAIVSGNVLRLSKLFEWYTADFKDARTFVARYRRLPPGLRPVTDIEYDWRVNYSAEKK